MLGRFRLLYITTHMPPDALWETEEWRVRTKYGKTGYGHPTDKRLIEYCQALDNSTEPTGCNRHLNGRKIVRAKIVDDATGQTVANYERPS